jgi:16S rRNA (guanine966-N2)-methyltransferase
MRIIGGALRGRSLKAPLGLSTRPTSDRARQALFDVLAHADFAPDLAGARAVDLFAGSGALGLEALSRGAAFCLFVETAEAARAAIQSNLEALDLFGRGRVHRRDATRLGPRPAAAGPPFDLAFLDPPYRQGLGERAAAALLEGGWLREGALLVLERAADEPAPALDGFRTADERTWGAARMSFAVRL